MGLKCKKSAVTTKLQKLSSHKVLINIYIHFILYPFSHHHIHTRIQVISPGTGVGEEGGGKVEVELCLPGGWGGGGGSDTLFGSY